jgi:hypothetical protein
MSRHEGELDEAERELLLRYGIEPDPHADHLQTGARRPHPRAGVADPRPPRSVAARAPRSRGLVAGRPGGRHRPAA